MREGSSGFSAFRMPPSTLLEVSNQLSCRSEATFNQHRDDLSGASHPQAQGGCGLHGIRVRKSDRPSIDRRLRTGMSSRVMWEAAGGGSPCLQGVSGVLSFLSRSLST